MATPERLASLALWLHLHVMSHSAGTYGLWGEQRVQDSIYRGGFSTPGPPSVWEQADVAVVSMSVFHLRRL